jgi:hypothetical protein
MSLAVGLLWREACLEGLHRLPARGTHSREKRGQGVDGAIAGLQYPAIQLGAQPYGARRATGPARVAPPKVACVQAQAILMGAAFAMPSKKGTCHIFPGEMQEKTDRPKQGQKMES